MLIGSPSLGRGTNEKCGINNVRGNAQVSHKSPRRSCCSLHQHLSSPHPSHTVSAALMTSATSLHTSYNQYNAPALTTSCTADSHWAPTTAPNSQHIIDIAAVSIGRDTTLNLDMICIWEEQADGESREDRDVHALSSMLTVLPAARLAAAIGALLDTPSLLVVESWQESGWVWCERITVDDQ